MTGLETAKNFRHRERAVFFLYSPIILRWIVMDV